MAAPMSDFVRIRLHFENDQFENTWLLFDNRKCLTIEDVAIEIRNRYGIGRKEDIVLFLMGHVLRNEEKSKILRDDDLVCVRYES